MGHLLSPPVLVSLPLAEDCRLVLRVILGSQSVPTDLTPHSAIVPCGFPVIRLSRLATVSAFHAACCGRIMSITASGDGLSSSEDEDSARLLPSGVVASAESDLELMVILSRATSIVLEV